MINNPKQKTAIIIGAGPAGLTAAYELLNKTDIKPIIYEMSNKIGGLSRTINHEGDLIDIGPHRFFSKSNEITQWWNNILPIQNEHSPEIPRRAMLIRNRLTRIFFLRKFFDYPITLNADTIRNLGFNRIIKIAASYIMAKIIPIKNEKSLEDFFINRFGEELYFTFFKDYTEKVWGVPCEKIKSEWGVQRIKGLSLRKAIAHGLKKIITPTFSINQKQTETSLIEKFLYPKFGAGHLWEEVAKIIRQKGGVIHHNHRVVGLKNTCNQITKVRAINESTGEIKIENGDYFISTMPVKYLITCLDAVPQTVCQLAEKLPYRDLVQIAFQLKKLKIKDNKKHDQENSLILDNWLYIQENDVKMGRITIYNNMSRFMVKINTVLIGVEYFCNEGDSLWNKSDDEFKRIATEELIKTDIINEDEILKSFIVRAPKAYPAYFGAYDQFDTIRNFIDQFENLFLIGRNGMHKYNNMDHSMLTAMAAVDNIINNIKTKDNIWTINAEQEYHESK